MRVKRPTHEELEQMLEKLKKESHVRTQAAETLRESEKLYRFLTENTNDMITRHLPDSTYLYISPACRTLFGYTPEELLGTKAFALIHPEDVERVITVSQEAVKTGELRMGQYRHLKKDGQYIWVETVGKVIKNELTGNIEDIICVVRDITERKRIEEILKASEKKYRTLVESFTDAIVMVDQERKIVSCNQAFNKLFGYDKDEVERKSAKIFHPSDESFNAYGKLVYPIVNKTGFFRTEWNFMRKDGTIFPVEIGTSVIKSPGGSITGFVVVIRDITERKQAEEESKKYQTLFETSNDAIMMMNEDKFVDGNQATLDLFGFTSKADFITKSPADLSPPAQADGMDSLTAQKQHLARTFETETDFFEWVHKKADGTLFPAEVKLSRLPLGEGMVVQALVRDITERKRAEENLQRIKIAVESAGDAISMATPQGVHFYHNQSFTDLFGYSIEELQKPLGPKIVFADAMIAREVFKTIMQGNSWRGEIMMVAKSGRQFPVTLKANAVKDDKGNIIGLIGIFSDITERKRTENTLRESEERYRTMMEQAADAVFMHDETGRIMEANCKVCQSLGYSREELLSMSIGDIDPEAIQSEKHKLWGKVFAGERFTFESHQRRKDGSLIPVEVTLGSVHLPHGPAVLGIVRDITDRKQAEELFRSLAANSPVGVYIVQQGKFVYANLQLQQYTSYRAEELLGMEALSLVFPEDRETVRNNAIQMLKGKRVIPYEFRITNKNGEIKWALESVVSIQHQGKQAAIGSYQDITERKRVEQEVLRQSTILEGINHVLRDTLRLETDKEVALTCLTVAQKITGSKFGWIGEVNPSGRLDTIAMSDPGWDLCRMDVAQTQPAIMNMEICGSIWGRVLKDGKSLIANDPTIHPDRVGLPSGHPVLTAFLGVPLKKDDKTIGMISLANKPSGYTSFDQESVEELSIAVVEALRRKRAEEEREKLIIELRASLEKVKTLGGLLPICAACKKIRDDKGYWNQIESYIRDHSDAEFSHGICPECMKKLYPDFEIIE